MATLTISPEVLVWARESAALARDDAARALKVAVERLEAWERGDNQPGLTVLRSMATKYKRPLATLLLPEPPPPDSFPTDFRLRTVDGKRGQFSPELSFALREALEWQEMASELFEDDPSLFVRPDIPRATLESDVEQLAEAERKRLRITSEEQLAWRQDARFRRLRARVQSQGILVFVKKLTRQTCRAFSLWGDQPLPVIVVTNDDAAVAQSFSLFHEYAHLMLRQEAVCLGFESGSETERGQVERFCNRFSAALLMSAEILETVLERPLAAFGDHDWTLDQLDPVARRIGVSRPALALRLEDLGVARKGLAQSILARVGIPDEARVQRVTGGANFLATRLSERGTAYSMLTLGAWRKKAIPSAEAAEMLNIPARTLADYEHQTVTQQERYGG